MILLKNKEGKVISMYLDAHEAGKDLHLKWESVYHYIYTEKIFRNRFYLSETGNEIKKLK